MCYPTQTANFFGHLNCRLLGPLDSDGATDQNLYVLEKDYSGEVESITHAPELSAVPMRLLSTATDLIVGVPLRVVSRVLSGFVVVSCHDIGAWDRTLVACQAMRTQPLRSVKDSLIRAYVFVSIWRFRSQALISIGAPLFMFLWMRRKMQKEMSLVKQQKKAKIHAYQAFHRKFGYMTADFKPDAYCAFSACPTNRLSLESGP